MILKVNFTLSASVESKRALLKYNSDFKAHLTFRSCMHVRGLLYLQRNYLTNTAKMFEKLLKLPPCVIHTHIFLLDSKGDKW